MFRPIAISSSGRVLALALAVLVVAAGAAARAADAPLKDPMQPYQPVPSDAQGAVEQPFRLTGVLVSDTRRVAVINGKRLGVGERIDGAEVTRIDPKRVELRRGGEPLVLRLTASAAQ